MLQDTDLFERLADLSNVGGDVSCSVEWAESPSPDERYDVNLTWAYRHKTVGTGHYIIEPKFNSDEFRLFWVHLEFIEDWQDKGLYTTLVKSYAALPAYGITEVVATPWDKEAERRLSSEGFAWVGHEFVLDLRKAS